MSSIFHQIRIRSNNRKYKTIIKNSLKKINNNYLNFNKEISPIKKNILELQKVLDKAASKKVIHKNKSRRLKSKMHKKLYHHLSLKAKNE